MKLVEIGQAVSLQYPGTRIGGFTLGATPSRACAVATPLGHVYVNPYTLEVTGQRPAD